MDNLNITMEEYIRLQEEKSLSRGETFDWQTTTYGKMKYCKDEDDSFTKFRKTKTGTMVKPASNYDSDNVTHEFDKEYPELTDWRRRTIG
ncbi:hypothetical protein Tco_1042716 [Tanacetum coccineum]|uniref:Uncharacterized protein n=1 Tax=Tanacetum coccineum TaxID=301880 RepID=A0ABQ5GJX6_9ASTR